jgi:hypothetical protein
MAGFFDGSNNVENFFALSVGESGNLCEKVATFGAIIEFDGT